jgi:hypothetical protein
MSNAAPASAVADKTGPKTAAVYAAQPRQEAEPATPTQIAAHALADRTAAARGILMRMQQTHGNQVVLRMLANSPQAQDQVKRKCACSGGSGDCAECAAEQEASLNRQANDGTTPDRVPPIINDVLRSPGQPLDSETRAFMEPRFGSDLSGVRVHTDRKAAESAAAVNALAYSVGRHVVFASGRYSPASTEGRSLIAHELAHVVQQDGDDSGAPQRISDPEDAAEREADSAAQAVLRMPFPTGTAAKSGSAPAMLARKPAGPAMVRRKIVVSPSNQTQFIAEELDTLCPGQLQASGNTISQSCTASTNQSCNCACDVAADPARTYSVHVSAAPGSTTAQTLWNGSTEPVPSSTLWPNTEGGDNPTISVESADSNIEFGFFKADGSPSWYPHWRILAHELCGHGRLRQTYDGETGNRPQHDSTIDTENALAAEHGGPARGHFKDKRQGEAFYNPVGDRSRVVFKQKDGLHYEAP